MTNTSPSSFKFLPSRDFMFKATNCHDDMWGWEAREGRICDPYGTHTGCETRQWLRRATRQHHVLNTAWAGKGGGTAKGTNCPNTDLVLNVYPKSRMICVRFVMECRVPQHNPSPALDGTFLIMHFKRVHLNTLPTWNECSKICI
jgi:hypothetical protein